MVIPKKYTTTTKTSKLFALFLFIALLFIGFYLGSRYQKIKSDPSKCLNETVVNKISLSNPKPSYSIEKKCCRDR